MKIGKVNFSFRKLPLYLSENLWFKLIVNLLPPLLNPSSSTFKRIKAVSLNGRWIPEWIIDNYNGWDF